MQIYAKSIIIIDYMGNYFLRLFDKYNFIKNLYKNLENNKFQTCLNRQ